MWQAAGQAGEVRAGFRHVARLGAWRFQAVQVAPAGHGTVTASVMACDRFLASHGEAYTVFLRAGTARWRWDGVRVAWSEAGCEAIVVGAPVVDAWPG